MRKKLSTKEREEVMTKGHLEDQGFVTKRYLDAQGFVTKEYFHSTLEEVLESKNYATKDFVSEVFETYQLDMKNHINALMEENRSYILGLIDAFNGRFERIERHVGLERWGA